MLPSGTGLKKSSFVFTCPSTFYSSHSSQSDSLKNYMSHATPLLQPSIDFPCDLQWSLSLLAHRAQCHQCHHPCGAQLGVLSSLSLLCSCLASLLFSDPQNTVLHWELYRSIPWKVCLSFILRLPSLISVRSLCKYHLINPPQSSLISFPATFSHRPYHHLTHRVFYLLVCSTPLRCKCQQSRDFCLYHSCFIPECLQSTSNMVGVHSVLAEWISVWMDMWMILA